VAYQNHFRLVDDLLPHLDATVGAVTDPFIASRYSGFLALSSATVLELCVKELLIEHASTISPVFGVFVSKSYERLNGRVRVKALKEEHLPRYGAHYVAHFSKLLSRTDRFNLRSSGRSTSQSYDNVITWRHGFAHEGIVPPNATYGDVRNAYIDSKVVVQCLAKTLSRIR
jgi:hypothetical protein